MYKAMRGLGTDDDALQRGVIFTSEVKLKFLFIFFVHIFLIYFCYYKRKVTNDLSGDLKRSKLSMRRNSEVVWQTTSSLSCAETTRTSCSPSLNKP